MNAPTLISIDPGASGGIAWKEGDIVNAVAMPDTRGDCIALIKTILVNGKPAVAYHEKISGYIPDGGPSMMFQFGANCERVGCILETLGVRIIEITPQAWQKDFGFGKKGFLKKQKGMNATQKKDIGTMNATLKREWKNKLKAESQRRFPGVPVTLKTCDALLILDFAIRREQQPKHEELNLFS